MPFDFMAGLKALMGQAEAAAAADAAAAQAQPPQDSAQTAVQTPPAAPAPQSPPAAETAPQTPPAQLDAAEVNAQQINQALQTPPAAQQQRPAPAPIQPPSAAVAGSPGAPPSLVNPWDDIAEMPVKDLSELLQKEGGRESVYAKLEGQDAPQLSR